jgi:hypothetical protein
MLMCDRERIRGFVDEVRRRMPAVLPDLATANPFRIAAVAAIGASCVSPRLCVRRPDQVEPGPRFARGLRRQETLAPNCNGQSRRVPRLEPGFGSRIRASRDVAREPTWNRSHTSAT